ncbi:MAG: C25 family cysteine peptidase [Marinicellaceae bacterium]
MNLPNAITKYLAAYQSTSQIEHILLIGNDTYDYKNYLGINSTSFIPTKYAPTVYIPHTPSDALLTDLNNDGLSNISIGRWPVRNMDELNHIVNKTLQWSETNDISAIFMTDIEENESNSFELQASNMIQSLLNIEPSLIDITEVFPSKIEINSGENIIDKSRDLLFNGWQNGFSLTNFIGHGSPTQWSQQGILASGDLAGLFNENYSTLIGTSTCYSSYFVAPSTNSLSLNLMNGFNGRQNGAVAIHGASTLSSYSGNEIFANHVLEQQLQGETLGKAILSARILSRNLGYNDQVINWVLLGDPTLRIKY